MVLGYICVIDRLALFSALLQEEKKEIIFTETHLNVSKGNKHI